MSETGRTRRRRPPASAALSGLRMGVRFKNHITPRCLALLALIRNFGRIPPQLCSRQIARGENAGSNEEVNS